MKERNNKNRENVIINATRANSSGDFSSDTTEGHVKDKGVNLEMFLV